MQQRLKLLVFNKLTMFLGAPGNDTLIRNCLPLDPVPPLRISVAIRGEDMDIFWNYTYHLKFLLVFTHCW